MRRLPVRRCPIISSRDNLFAPVHDQDGTLPARKFIIEELPQFLASGLCGASLQFGFTNELFIFPLHVERGFGVARVLAIERDKLTFQRAAIRRK